MESNFLSRFTLKQKIIALLLSVVMVFSLIGATLLEVNRQETAAAAELDDPMTDPSKAFAAQENTLSKQGTIWFGSSQTCLQNGDYANALSWVNKVIEKDGKLPLLLLQRAAVYVAMENYSPAADDYSTVLASYPDYTQLYQVRGAVYSQMGSSEKAYQDYDRYLKAVPDDTESLTAHANLAVVLQKYDAALLDINNLLDIEPQNGSLLALKGDILTLLSRPQEAIDSYFLATDYLTDASMRQSVWIALGSLYQSNNDFASALAAYQSALDISTDSGEVWFQLGVCQIQTASYKKAASSFTKALKLSYEPALSHFQRGLCYYTLENPDKAIKDLESYEKTVSGADSDASDAYIYLALSYADAGKTNSAISYFKKCIKKDIMTAESHYYLGNLYLKTEAYAEAISHFTSSIKENYLTASCYYNRGVCYLRSDDITHAQADFQTVVSLGTDSSLSASAQDALNQIDDAKQAAIDQQKAELLAAAQAQAAAQAAANAAEEAAKQKAAADAANKNESSSDSSDNTSEKSYHTVIIKEGTLENPSAEINQSSENYQTSD
jgi:tetratricopeptide (TPR) repeat protein